MSWFKDVLMDWDAVRHADISVLWLDVTQQQKSLLHMAMDFILIYNSGKYC